MTPIRKNTFIRQIKHISIGSTLALGLLGHSAFLQSCSSSDDNGAEGSYEEVEVYEKGVKMLITETQKGQYQITNETEVPIDSSVAIVKTFDGRELKLSPAEAKRLIDDEIAQHETQVGQSSNLSNVLLYGGMGYLLAKTTSPNYGQYRPDLNSNFYNAQNDKDSTHRRRHGLGMGHALFFGRFYGNSARYEQAVSVSRNIESSRTVHTRPSGGRSGFFGGRSRGFGG